MIPAFQPQTRPATATPGTTSTTSAHLSTSACCMNSRVAWMHCAQKGEEETHNLGGLAIWQVHCRQGRGRPGVQILPAGIQIDLPLRMGAYSVVHAPHVFLLYLWQRDTTLVSDTIQNATADATYFWWFPQKSSAQRQPPDSCNGCSPRYSAGTRPERTTTGLGSTEPRSGKWAMPSLPVSQRNGGVLQHPSPQ